MSSEDLVDALPTRLSAAHGTAVWRPPGMPPHQSKSAHHLARETEVFLYFIFNCCSSSQLCIFNTIICRNYMQKHVHTQTHTYLFKLLSYNMYICWFQETPFISLGLGATKINIISKYHGWSVYAVLISHYFLHYPDSRF